MYDPVFTSPSPLPPSLHIAWDLLEGAEVATFQAMDADVGPDSSRVGYSLAPVLQELPSNVMDGQELFSIDSSTGSITLTRDLTSVQGQITGFVLFVRASDSGQPQRSAPLRMLTLMPFSTTWFLPHPMSIEVEEELTLGTVIIELRCDEIGPLTNSARVTLSGAGSENFRIEKNFKVVVTRRIDYESLPEFERTINITATCSNRFNLFNDTTTLSLTIRNIDDNIFSFSMTEYDVSLQENMPTGVLVLTVQAEDRDVQDLGITYRLAASDGMADFDLVSNPPYAEIRVRNHLDRETRPVYVLTVTAAYDKANGYEATTSAMVRINIFDVNDERPRFVPGVYTINNITTVSEVGDLVIAVSARDDDAGTNAKLTYTLPGSADFEIDATTGEIYVAQTLLHGRYDLIVNATDEGDNPLSGLARVIVYVQATPNRIPLILSKNPISIAEDTPIGMQIGRVSSSIVDESNATLNETSGLTVTFQIVNGTDTDRFHIGTTTGEIFTLASLDYDRLATEYDLLIRAELELPDTQPPEILTNETVLTVRVVNLDDNPPLFAPMFYAEVVEQFALPGTVILTVSAYDPDMLAEVQYSLAGEDSSSFQINSSSGEISARVELDTPQDYRFSATATDGGDKESMAVIFISVTRSVSVTRAFTRGEFTFFLSESATPGTVVGNVSAIARGDRQSVEFSHLGFRILMPDPVDFNLTALLTEHNLTAMPSTNSSLDLFHIDMITGTISTRGIFEFDVESRENYVFYVEVYNVNNGMVYDLATVTVHLLDENDNAPMFERSLYTRVINTSEPLNSVIAQLTATDKDFGFNRDIMYAFQGQNVTLGFALDHASGEISVSNSTLIPGDYYLYIEATDRGSPVLSDLATLFVAIIPDTPEDIEFTEPAYTFQIAEDAPPNTLVGTIQVMDSNTSLVPPGLVYSTSNVTDCFVVDENSGEVRVSCTTIDRDTTATYELPVRAQVGDGAVAYGTVKVLLLDINDNFPVFTLDIYTRVIDDRYSRENTSRVVIQVEAVDADNGINGSVRYDLVSGNGIFRIDNTTGKIFLVNESVAIGDYRLLVQATDMGVPENMSSTVLVLIYVTRAHPQALQFSSHSFHISEDIMPGSIIGTAVLTTTNGENIVNPEDFLGNLKFSIVGGDSPELFFVEESTGVVRTRTQTIDREMAATHVIEILANFTQFTNIPMQSIQRSFTVTVLDVNDNAPLLLAVYAVTIDDATPSNQGIINNITSTDVDLGSNAEVFFRIGPQPPFVFPTGVFGVQVTGDAYPMTFGEIFVSNSSILVPGIYRFLLTAFDNGVPQMSSMAQVEIIVEHAIPEDIAFTLRNYNFSVVEETLEGTAVGNASIASLTPALDDLVYGITGGSGEGFFLIDSATGAISRAQRRIDRETVTSFQLNISAYLPDQDPPLTADATVDITVVDANDNFPLFSRNVYRSVGIDTDELSTSEFLLRVAATDIDVGTNEEIDYNVHAVTLNQTLQSDAFLFFTVNRTGDVFPASTLLVVGVYHLNICASDRGTPTRTSYSSVTIVVQQPAPTSISFTSPEGYTFVLPEGMGVVPVGRVMLADIPDYLLQFVSYSSSDSLFTISSNEGTIRTTQSYDYEVEKTFNFVVTSSLIVTSRTPSLHLVTMVNVTVVIVDVNDNTPYFIDFPTEITQYEERPQSEVVHTIAANDSDFGSNARLQYCLLNTNLMGLLTIDRNSGEIIASAGLDREDPIQGANHTIIIEVCDSGPIQRCIDRTTMFRLLDINDNRPQLDSGFTYDVDERRPPQSRVITFVGLDPDVGENGTIRYSLVSTDVPFICNNISGEVRLTEELDYEMQTSYNLIVRLTDLGSRVVLFNEYTNVTVRVVNLPDNTPRFNQTLYESNTDPTVLLGDILFRLQATDADIPSSNDSLRYAIIGIRETGNYGNLPDLQVGETTGHVTSGINQVYLTEAVFTVDILVYDLSRFNLSSTTTLEITVVPDPIAFTEEVYIVTVMENSPLRTIIANLPITNLSASSDITYSIEVPDPPPPPGLTTFTHSGNGGHVLRITLSDPGTGLDREVVSRFVVEATASRPGGMARARVVVNVGDENDNTPQFLDTNHTVLSIAEDAVSQTVVTKSNATDQDTGENARLEYRILGRASTFPFAINRTSGVISLVSVVDYEDVPFYDITVLVRDLGTPPRSNQIVYRIDVMNVNDNPPVFAAPAYFGEVYGRAPVNDLVLHTELRVTDADDVNNEQTLTFNIVSADRAQDDGEYEFRVEAIPPYQIRVISLHDNSDTMPRLLDYRVEVRDEGNILARVPLYISIFTTNNLATFILSGVSSEEELFSCETMDSSLCAFRQGVATLVRADLASTEGVTFYNYTVEPFGDGNTLVSMCGSVIL